MTWQASRVVCHGPYVRQASQLMHRPTGEVAALQSVGELQSGTAVPAEVLPGTAALVVLGAAAGLVGIKAGARRGRGAHAGGIAGLAAGALGLWRRRRRRWRRRGRDGGHASQVCTETQAGCDQTCPARHMLSNGCSSCCSCTSTCTHRSLPGTPGKAGRRLRCIGRPPGSQRC